MFKKLLFLFIIFILIISCRRATTRPTLDSIGTPPEDPNAPVIDETPKPEEDFIIKASDTEDEIESKIKKYYDQHREYVALVEDTKENIDNNNTIEKINNVINRDIFYQGVSLDLISTDITEIKDNAFKNNLNLASIEFPETLITIGTNAFNNCNKMTNINFPTSLKYIGIVAFRTCKSLEEVDLEYTKITILSNYVFSDCANLTKVILPAGLLGIENSAFSFCISLEEISFPKDFSVIGNSVFYGCTSLKKVNFNDKIKSIYHYAFYGCTSLSKISLPSSLTKLGATGPEVFTECTSLSDVEYLGKVHNAIIYPGNVFGTSNPQNLYLPNVDDPATYETPPDTNPWDNFLGYNWANKIKYKQSMPNE